MNNTILKENDVHSYIQAQENNYQSPIMINNSWSWGMVDHIKTTVCYKNSQLKNGKDEFTPVKNITRPILNLQYRAEGFDVKDITLYVDDSQNYYKSFLVKKFHEKWARENAIDTFIDGLVESYVDFGGALIKNVNDVKPEVVPLQSIVFCDQTDILSGPIGIKHYYSPDQLLDMESKGWGDTSKGATATLEEAITLSREVKKDNKGGSITQTPGKYIEVYEVHGNLPKRFLDESDTSGKYVSQIHIVCFYQKTTSEKGLITLYKAEEKRSPFKFIARDAVFGRALGFGGAEELFEPQVWVNYAQIRKQRMIDAASVTVLKSTDPNVAQTNKVRDMENLSIITLQPNSDLSQVDTFPRNVKLFDDATMEWEQHAQQMGSANDSIMGNQPASGTPFKLQELVTQESHSLHEYRKGKIATFLEEIYRECSLKYIASEIAKGQEFMSELDLEELQYVSDSIVTNAANNMIKEKILNGELIEPDEVEGYKEIVRGDFKKKGNKHFIQILKDEFKNIPVDVKVNIAGKQKDLGQAVDKIVNVLRFVIGSNPLALSFPGTWDLINQIVEKSGLDPVDFSGLADGFKKQQAQQQQMEQQQAQQQQMQSQQQMQPQPQPVI